MRETALEYLSCPVDMTSLKVYSVIRNHDEVMEGILHCPSCKRWYPITEGIPVFYRDEDRKPSDRHILEGYSTVIPAEILSDGRPYNAAGDQEISGLPVYFDYHPDAYDTLLDSPYLRLVEINRYIEALALSETDTVLELGCGTGRMTKEIAGRCSKVVALDYSMNMLRSHQRKLRGITAERVTLICGDVSYLPFAPDSFSRVCSFQVFEHLPLPMRELAYARVRSTMKRDGEFTLSVYNWSLAKRVFDRKESYPAERFGKEEGQYAYCFTWHELRNELETFFHIVNWEGIRNIPARSVADRLGRRGLEGPILGIDRLLSRSALGLLLGHLLLVQCRQPITTVTAT